MRASAKTITLVILICLSTLLSKTYAADRAVPIVLSGNSSPVLHASARYEGFQKNPDAHSLVIDDKVRQIGGQNWERSSQQEHPPLLKFAFQADKTYKSESPILVIGAIRGINTPEAHQAGLSQANFISSPTVIKVNGYKVGYIYTEGQNLSIPIPSRVLHPGGYNTVQVEAGYYFLAENFVAYDQIEFQNLFFEY